MCRKISPASASSRPTPKSKTRFAASRHQHRLPEQDHVAGDALGNLLAADAGAWPGIAATVVLWLGGRQVLQGTMTLGRVRRLQRLSGDAHLAADGDRLHGQPVSARHRGALPYRRSSWTRRFRRVTVTICRRSTPSRSGAPSNFAISPLPMARSTAPVLKNINLKIPAGTVCGIVGDTGSGKSTLVNLLLRLYEPADQHGLHRRHRY